MYAEQDGSNLQLPAKNGERIALYAAISPRASVTARRPPTWRPTVAVTSGERRGEIGFKTGEGHIEHLSARHDDDVESRWQLQSAKQLAGETLGPVPHHG